MSVLCPGVVNTNIFDSGRNRPDALQAESDTASMVLQSDVPAEDQATRLEELMANALDADIVGDMVLHAIQTNEFYIFTHPELQVPVQARAEQMAASFDRWREFREKHDVTTGGA